MRDFWCKIRLKFVNVTTQRKWSILAAIELFRPAACRPGAFAWGIAARCRFYWKMFREDGGQVPQEPRNCEPSLAYVPTCVREGFFIF